MCIFLFTLLLPRSFVLRAKRVLRFLSIENFALIDRLQVEFESGLNLITGETGSGKSILVDAVSLLVGERASQEMVREGFDRARIEGIFSLPAHSPARQKLEQSGLDANSDELIIRREIATSGANKIFVNGTLATQRFLADLGSFLADIHGQHEQQQLLQPKTHLEFLDAFGGNEELRQEVSEQFHQLQETRQTLDHMRKSEQQRLQRLDNLNFQISDIEKLQLSSGLDQELEGERRLLSSAQQRYEACQESYELLYERDESLLALVDRLEKNLQTLATLDKKFDSTLEKLNESRYQMEELAYQIRDYRGQIEFDPARLEMVQEHLAEIQKARRKYGGSVEEILSYCERIRGEVEELSHGQERTEQLVAKEKSLSDEYLHQARRLSRKRRQDGVALERSVEQELRDLAMEQTNFSVEIDSQEVQANEHGIDRGAFLISPNPGEPPRPLVKIASGGELSRVVLALKSILSLENYPKTLVFDEVDSGIGARVAGKLGEKLAKLSTQHQVFCVTHLPQIASFASRHFHVEKQTHRKRTLVEITPLRAKARVEELARMMAGDRLTETTRKQARELLEATASTRNIHQAP